VGVEDVVIIGGGPAGLACAWHLAEGGLSPLVLEAASFPRDKVCGDALSGKVVSVLRRLGGEALIRRMAAEPFVLRASALVFVNDRGDRVRLSLSGEVMGFTAPRYAWDAWLWSQAPRNIRLRPKTPVLRIERAERHWVLYLPQGERVQARYLIGADGVASKVRPWVYTYRRARRPPVYSAVRAYAEYPVMPGELELHYVPPYLPGYWWAFAMAGGQVNIGIGGPPKIARSVSFRQGIRHLLGEKAPKAIAGHGIPLYRAGVPLTAPGCALIGDAGHLVDPFTGEGIGNALLSGYRLAQAILKAQPADLFTWDAREVYENPLHHELKTEMRVSTWLHHLSRSPLIVRWLLRRLSQRPDLQETLQTMLFQPEARLRLYSPRFYWQLMGF
jgi:geranylgeranyl reductase family protein